MACPTLAELEIAMCESGIGREENLITLLQVTAQAALNWAQSANPGADYSLTAIETRACESRIGWETDQSVLLRVIAQNLCNLTS